MKTALSIFLILILTSNLKAQDIWKDTTLFSNFDRVIEPELKQFKRSKIDTLFIYTEYCWGCVYPNDNSEKCDNPSWNHMYYFIWKKNNETYFTVRDDCFEYATLKIDSYFFEYFYSIKDSLINDKLKEPKYYIDHAYASKLIMIDKQNNFALFFDGAYFYEDTTNPAIIFNNTTLRKVVLDNLNNYLKKDLLTYLIPSRQRKNYR